MPRRIHILPDAVANQIAAGEVVERPASVVKELVENALDAGATSVQILVEAGGKHRIRASDDGAGMVREDALLSLDRHATSKIAEAGDLLRVATFGFRGEALPSIAAVSRLTLETREAEEEVGTALRVEGGRIVAVRDFPRRRGTTVEVRSLFFNAPARAKFLRPVAAETRAVSEAVISLALAHPSVAFTLTSGSRVLLELAPAPGIGPRVEEIFGREEGASLLPFSAAAGRLRLRGLLQRPDAVRPGFRRAYLFANGRPFRDGGLIRAAERGYRTTVAPGLRPWLFLFLEAPEGEVDVNVHPAKLEVRFRDRGEVESLLEEGIRAALAQGESGATLDPASGPAPLQVREGSPGREGASRPGRPPREEVSQMALFLSGAPEEGERGRGEGGAGESGAPLLKAPRPRLWQIHDTYILAEVRDGLLLIDQHSAHERVLFQRLMEAFQEGGEEGQRLLIPLTLRLTPAEVQEVRELEGLLSRAGFQVEEFGGDTVIVHAVPDPHPYFDAERCLREMIGELTEGSELVRSARNQHERIAKTFACKGAIKAGQGLSHGEMEELFDALFATELPYHDVHGRPTIVRLSKQELERKFGR